MHEQGWRKQLRELATGKVLFDECMDRHTSIGVGGRADALVVPESAVELGRIVALLRAGGVPVFFAGNGTNLIVRDDGFRGAVVSTKGLRTVRLEGRGQDRAAIRAEAGASLAEVVALSAREGLTGMEFCAGIPGSVGGGIRMNAGAYGSEMKDVLESVDLLNGEGNVKTCARAALQFEYRNLALPEGACVLGGVFDLARGNREAVEGRIREILKTRSGKHPLQYRNAGSVFKNPKGMPAGRIIDEAGLKGLTLGGARVSEMHGNFIVNLGSATAKDIIGLIELVREKVRERKGIDLEPEVKIIGEE
ncbi:MAG: UDP-N-acetylmuramate dehydrogenase [Syntrophales bacterium]|nr:UDP-N-acetylmuramate dehydrogenase [Syntrophales bacterium]